MECIRRPHVEQVGSRVVQIRVVRLNQRRFQKSLVTYSCLSSEEMELLLVVSENLLLC